MHQRRLHLPRREYVLAACPGPGQFAGQRSRETGTGAQWG